MSPVPNCTRNGFDGVIQRSLHSAFEDRVCLIATVRLAKPQFIKVKIVSCSSTSHFAFLSGWHTFGCVPLGLKKVVLIRTGLDSNGCPVTPGKLGSCQPLCAVSCCLCWQPLFFCLKTLYLFVSFPLCKIFPPAELKSYCWFYLVCWKLSGPEWIIKSNPSVSWNKTKDSGTKTETAKPEWTRRRNFIKTCEAK